VSRAREREHAPPLEHRDLADHVRRRSEPVQPEPLRVAGEAQRPEADQPAAQKRRGLMIRNAVGDREAEALVRDRQLGEAAVDVPARKARPDAQVLPTGAAITTVAVRPAEPRNTDPAAV